MYERERTLVVSDRLYGRFEVPREIQGLFEVPEFVRLHSLALDILPPWASPTSVVASKAEHSLGVAHLADVVTRKPGFRDSRANIILAAALHDVATPPFSHSSDPFLKEIYGHDHEEWAEEIILNSGPICEVIRQNGGSPEVVAGIISGREKPLCDLIAGTIDLDNLDNTPRYALSKGITLRPYYDPERLADFFEMDKGRVVLNGLLAGLKAWQDCRHDVYQFVYSEANLSPVSMLYRALEIFYRDGLLGGEFFLMTDEGALRHMLGKVHPEVTHLLEDAAHWRFYPMVFQSRREMENIEIGEGDLIRNWKTRAKVADNIAKEFGLDRYEVCVYAGADKGYRRIHLPFVVDGKNVYHDVSENQTFITSVFVHPRYSEKAFKIREFCRELLSP